MCFCKSNYNLNGSLSSIDDFFLRATPVGVSDAPDGRRRSLDTAVCWSGWTGVLEPDGVRVLEAVLNVGATPIVTCLTLFELALLDELELSPVKVGMLEALDMPVDLGAGLAGDRRPLGVLGLEPVPFRVVFLADDSVAELRPEVVGVRLGILEGVSSVLSSDKFDPCLEGGLLPGLLPVLDAGLELFLDPPGVMFDRYVGLLGVLNPLSLSLNESGVPADNDDLVLRGKLPIGTDLCDLSLTQ